MVGKQGRSIRFQIFSMAILLKGLLHQGDAFLSLSMTQCMELKEWEEDNPLQALHWIAFAATSPWVKRSSSMMSKFEEFVRNEPVWEEQSFLDWIGDTPALLLIDELNILRKLLTDRDSAEAREFGSFLKYHFIRKEWRFLLFTQTFQKSLHSTLLDSARMDNHGIICWAPFHLQFVLEGFGDKFSTALW